MVLREGQNGQDDTSAFDFMISRVNLEGKLPFEMRFSRFSTKTMKFHVNLEGFLAVEIDLGKSRRFQHSVGLPFSISVKT